MTTVDDLAAWLTQIWDEDEAVARALKLNGRSLEGGSGSWFESGTAIGDRTGYVVAYTVEWDAARAHIVRHDPEHALARIAADRQILKRCTDYLNRHFGDDFSGDGLAEDVVKGLALQHADRPGYQEAWKPEA